MYNSEKTWEQSTAFTLARLFSVRKEAAMDDNRIIELYQARSEHAITATADKYGRYCYSIAYNILHNNEDSEECVNDTYLNAWNSIPPHNPSRLSTFLGKITRNLSLKRYETYTAQKRGNGQIPLVLDELLSCVPASYSIEKVIDDAALVETLNLFLASLPENTRKLFVRRYWYLSPVKEIARDFHLTESNVKVTLFRIRNQLKQYLEKEGISL